MSIVPDLYNRRVFINENSKLCLPQPITAGHCFTCVYPHAPLIMGRDVGRVTTRFRYEVTQERGVSDRRVGTDPYYAMGALVSRLTWR